MTCIIGTVSDGRVYIAGDAAVSAPGFVGRTALSKVFRWGQAVIGVCGTPRVAQILQTMSVPRQEINSAHLWLIKHFVPKLSAALQEHGIDPNSDEYSSSMLVGLKGRLFEIDSLLGVHEYMGDVHAVGSGAEYALGASAIRTDETDPAQRLRNCLWAASIFCPSVDSPFTVLVTE